jgi:hypothetical protein
MAPGVTPLHAGNEKILHWRIKERGACERARETTPVDIIDLCARQAGTPSYHKPSGNPFYLTTRFTRRASGFYTSAPNTRIPPERGKPSFHQIKYRKISVLYGDRSIFHFLKGRSGLHIPGLCTACIQENGPYVMPKAIYFLCH